MPSSASPATTEIYTLSLHDALPIYASARLRARKPARVNRYRDRAALQPPLASLSRQESGMQPTYYERLLADEQLGLASILDGDIAQDRKSTRLNSSHMSISYAVFCFSCDHRDLHSFPTRRSSDLCERAASCQKAGSCEQVPGSSRFAATARVPLTAGEWYAADVLRETARRRATRSRQHSGRRYRARSEEHTSELQSHVNLVCRLLLLLRPPRSTLFPYTTLFRSMRARGFVPESRLV